MQKYTKKFNELDKTKSDIAGGKGASLGEMLNAGIPVPNGFVVLSTTFEDFLQKADLIQEIDAILESVDHEAVHSVDQASEKIQELIKHAEMPSDIAKQIELEFATLDSEFVAVRSSATAEDGADHAWAGQLDSYLNTTKDALLEKVQQCWASLFTPRAIFYRFEKGLNTTKISVAVVVQRMVNSEKSGIAFSVHPVTEDRNQIIIEAGFGLGEAIVSGSVTPDSYVIEKEPRKIIDINISNQARAMYRKVGAGNEWQDLGEKGGTQVLTETEIFELANTIMTIENHYGFPCDIEWAYESGKFYIVQSRPITTLSQATDKKDIDNVALYLQDINITNITKQEGNFSSLIYMSLLPECFYPYSSRYYDFDFGKFLFVGKPKYGILFFNIEAYLQTSRVSFDHFLVSKITDFKEMSDFSIAGDKIQKMYRGMDVFSLSQKSEEELVDKIQKAFHLYWDILSSSIFSEAVYEDLVKELYKKVGGKDEEFSEFFSHASLLSFESFALRFDKQLVLYLEHKNIQETIWVFADYYDAPSYETFLLKVEKIIADKGGQEKIKGEIDRIEREVQENKQKQIPYYQTLSPELQKLFDYMQISMETRDIRKDPLQRVITLISFLAKSILAKYNIPSEFASSAMYQDFFNGLYTDKKYVDILVKRTNCVVLCNINGPHYEFSDPDIAINKIYKVLSGNTTQTKMIKGNSASKGKAIGSVKVILSENDFHKFQSGDILVTSMTRPEFVTLMKMAKAVITDEGGITCHAAIVSRELGLPCIIGTEMATRLLKDGDMVEVDAENGVIKIIN